MKKFVSIMLVCLFLFTGVLATSFAVSADDVEFDNADFDEFITILVGSLQAITNKDTRAARFNWYLDTIGSRDSEIDARISELYSGSAIADVMLNDLLDGGMEKDQVRLILEVLRSFPEEERAAAVLEFYANQDNGAYYDFADPTNENYNEDLDLAYQGIYDYYINPEFQATVLADYGLEYIDFVPFLRVLQNHFHLTTDSNGRLAVLAVSDELAENIQANVTATSMNGVEIAADPDNAKYVVMDQIMGKFSDGTTPENMENFKQAWKGEDAYELVGNISGDDEGNVDGIDVLILSRYVVGWSAVVTEIDADPVRYEAGAMIDPTNEDATTDDILKLLQYLAHWPNIVLGRATNSTYAG